MGLYGSFSPQQMGFDATGLLSSFDVSDLGSEVGVHAGCTAGMPVGDDRGQPSCFGSETGGSRGVVVS